jgi:hypothetical protein
MPSGIAQESENWSRLQALPGESILAYNPLVELFTLSSHAAEEARFVSGQACRSDVRRIS